ncbi:MAG TPA: ABC transporter ATP-binding protein [Bacteroidia bacterium]|jgi:lipoprotein-releasing system ATP-binding protein|nr:ABC transporter ATP-binding protein [Bacteroidia bacterium]
MIIAKGIQKSFGKLNVLKGIDLEVKKGEVVSIVGTSGAGKTTLLQILGTLDRADQGSIEINNTKIHTLKDRELSRFRNRQIGFVFQFHYLLPEFTAIENVCIPGFIAKTPTNEVRQKAEDLLTLLGLKERLEHKPSELSGGEQQRVAVARALINNPSVVFADEPSGNLDSANARELHKLFFHLRDTLSQTFVIATHNEELATMADRKITMKDGQIHS